jgi:hypothetical protein
MRPGCDSIRSCVRSELDWKRGTHRFTVVVVLTEHFLHMPHADSKVERLVLDRQHPNPCSPPCIDDDPGVACYMPRIEGAQEFVLQILAW